MITTERPIRFPSRAQPPAKPPMREVVLHAGQAQVGAASFLFRLKENPLGRFLRISEGGGEHCSERPPASLILPASGLDEFAQLVGRMVALAASPIVQSARRSEPIWIENKKITGTLVETAAGQCLHIIEAGGGHSNQLIVPSGVLTAFETQVKDMARRAQEIPFPFQPPRATSPHPAWAEKILKSILLPIERKSFMLLLKENRHGRFFRITEKAGQRFACLFVPVSGLAEFSRVLAEMIETLAAAFVVATPAPPAYPDEITLNRARIQVQEKTFVFVLKENSQGHYLRLVEESTAHPPVSLVIPAIGLAEFKHQLDHIIEISAASPLPNGS